jgi:hypothetical protein
MINPEIFLNLPDFFIHADSISSFLPLGNLMMRLVTLIGKPPPPTVNSDYTNSLTIWRLPCNYQGMYFGAKREDSCSAGRNERGSAPVDFLNKHFTALANSGTTTFFKMAQQCCMILVYMEDALKNQCKGNKIMLPVGLGESLMHPHVGCGLYDVQWN